MPVPTVLLDGLMFPEGPRWHDGRFWFSDMHAQQVVAVDMQGKRETMATVPQNPSGIGWLPDGRMVVVSMKDRKLMRQQNGQLVEHADLSGLAPFYLNDMVTGPNGNSYVGNFGFDLHGGGEFKATNIILVTSDGKVSEAASDLRFPNGPIITPDGRTLIVGESAGRRLTAFDIADDGSLSNRRLWAEVPGPPDGICLDAEGCIWASVPSGHTGVVRIAEGGEVKQQIAVERDAFACMLGGPDGRTLMICEADQSDPAKISGPGNGRITIVTVDVPRAGYP